ncbi:MAG: permease [Candidatus Dormibacteraeota bacterium]|uniref:Permease n=1 Tax=Candidatus Amunia macphersoniae TaxID=3127014 RepID=A0A934KM12_9BACT|nr:permease [Candidatus Dormibacteraeota bacterium]
MSVLGAIGGGLEEAFFMFWETLWALILGFGLSGVVQAFVSRGQMERVLGRPGVRTLGKATFLGMVSSSCSYAAAAMAKSLFQKGANFTAAMVFMIASTNLVIELGIILALLIGWQFTASEFVGGVLMIGLFALVSRFVFPTALVEAARERLRSGDSERSAHVEHLRDVSAPDDHAADRVPFAVRVRTLAGWSDAASYTMADITMLRREMVIGFGVAGFLAVLVPDAVWGHVFITGHGFWTALENAIVGPFIAIISFVCSIGNVPLAAALWKGGISFGGVVAFIFADLITLPLLVIYRKYYGTRMMLRILGSFWLVMSAGGLLVELLFQAVGVVPTTRPTQIAPERFALDYTSVLNVIFLIAFAGLYYLHRNRARFGGGTGYAIDPVCGMQVETSSAPARAVHDGTAYYFCSDGCHDRFGRQPERFAGPKSGGPEGMTEVVTDTTAVALDPVCGMSVKMADAAARRTRDGHDFYFCSAGCAEHFDREPAGRAHGHIAG